MGEAKRTGGGNGKDPENKINKAWVKINFLISNLVLCKDPGLKNVSALLYNAFCSEIFGKLAFFSAFLK